MKYNKYIRKNKLPTFWCPGCGYGQVMKSIVNAFEQIQVIKENTVIVSGIGCWGHVDSYISTNAFHGTHGRAMAFATGIKLANPKLSVIVVMGDGDGVTIGGNHFIHACRRNIDVTAIICNNLNYGMTGGQYSGTTPKDSITSTSRYGHIENGFDICKLADVAGAAYVARTISENVAQTTNILIEGMHKKGLSVIEVISPCPTHYGKNNAMSRPSDLYKWIKKRTISMKATKNMTSEQLEGRFIIGELVNRQKIDYGTKYRKIIADNFTSNSNAYGGKVNG